MDILSIVIAVVFVILWATYFYMFSKKGNTLYCRVFQRRDVKLSNEILSLPDDEFSLDTEMFRISGYYFFDIKSYPDWHVWFDSDKQEAIVSNKETHQCIVGSFYKKGSYDLYVKMCLLLPFMIEKFRNEHKLTFQMIDFCEEDLRKYLTSINQNNLENKE